MKRVESIEELFELAKQKKSVMLPNPWHNGCPLPAAFVIHMPTVLVYRLHKHGIYIYEPKKKSPPNK